MSTNYYIIKHDALTDRQETVFETSTFDKSILQAKFDELAQGLQEGEDLEYMKVDSKRFHPCMLVVTRRRGKLMRETARGYAPYNGSPTRQ